MNDEKKTMHIVEKETNVGAPEPWVDLEALAAHIGFSYGATRRMVIEGKLPGRAMKNGSRTYWRFRLSMVDAALASNMTQAIA